jgi:hypothetical protein
MTKAVHAASVLSFPEARATPESTMVAPIGSAATSIAAASARPQVQSRRVSLKLGPLGITYSSDALVWPAGQSQDEASASSPVGAASSASSITDASFSRQQQIEQRSDTRSFDQELLNAWRAQIGSRQDCQATYGPDGNLRGGAVQTDAAQAGGSGAADVDVQAANAQAGGQTAATSAAASTQNVNAATQSLGVGAAPSRMRKAIAAYLACAGGLAGGGSMLTAVA